MGTNERKWKEGEERSYREGEIYWWPLADGVHSERPGVEVATGRSAI
jgi:hypothetical protein